MRRSASVAACRQRAEAHGAARSAPGLPHPRDKKLNVPADYFAAVCIRYGLLLAAGGISRLWVLPHTWSTAIAAGVMIYGLVIIHTEPAARYARGFRPPWYRWMILAAAGAHAFAAAAVYALHPLTDPRFTDPRGDGMHWEVPWVYDPSLFDIGRGVVLYALLSAAWAVLAGWASRGVLGAAPPEQHRVHIRKRAAAER